jgi:hypothetical protein
MALFTCHTQPTATACFASVANEKRMLACGLLPAGGALGGARALGALGGAACVRLALGCAWHRTSGCAKRMKGVGWLGSPAMAFYLSAGVSSIRHAVPHTALPEPVRIWAALVHLCLGPPPARCAGRCAGAWRCLMSAPPARSVDGVAGMLAMHLQGRRIGF